MAERAHGSVTDVSCECGALLRAADEPDVPIRFDEETGEFYLTGFPIQHCPFCGGVAPKTKPSKPPLRFAIISDGEEERLANLLRPVRSIRSALKRFGKPESDDPEAFRTWRREEDGQPPLCARARILTYERLSEIADVEIIERADGSIHWYLVGKPLAGVNKPDG